jgi:HAD superfamily hydrolase (TIGR01509 family)
MSAPTVLLCDADGNLFPSEEPAFVASARVMNRLLESHGDPRRFSGPELQALGAGRAFRITAPELVAVGGEELEHWVEEERREVTAHLGRTLVPDPGVIAPLDRLATRFRLAVVSSSALGRLAACFTAAGLDALFPAGDRFSAEDSLDPPRSKPDPAVYLHACRQLGVEPGRSLAIEDSVTGTLSAVGAGVPTVGNLVYVPGHERETRAVALRDAGAYDVVDSWAALAAALQEE